MNNLKLKVLTTISYLVMVGTNYLAVSLPLGGRDTGAISDSYPNLFAPAGYTFSIWGLIYTLLGIYVIYQFGRPKDGLVTKINRLFVINGFLNASWIVAWHYDYIGISVLLMLALLWTLIQISQHLSKSKKEAQPSWAVSLPFRVYFGWITVATIANITVFLVSLGWRGWLLPESAWMVLVLLIGMAIGAWRLLLDRSLAYGLVLVWAYGGILAKHLSPAGFNGHYPEIIFAASLCILIFLTTILFINFKKIKK